MLAVQHAPTMASNRSPPDDPFLPFGYSFDPNQEPPTDPPPEPPNGDPLLTETDNRLISNFFEDINADQYNMPSFGEGLNFSNAWLDLPPQFMGSATSFGQEPHVPVASAYGQDMSNDPMNLYGQLPDSHSMPPPPAPSMQGYGGPNSNKNRHQHQQPHPQQQHFQHHQLQNHHQQHPSSQTQQPPQGNHLEHPEEVIEAASMLVQPTRRDSNSTYHAQRRNMGPPMGHLRHQPLEEFQEEGRRGGAQIPAEPAYPDWIQSPSRRTERPSASTDFQWGSDANFGGTQGYTPDANTETVESMHREQLKLLESLEVSRSANSTRPSSPQPSANYVHPPASIPKGPDDSDAPPRKRRKSKVNRGTEVKDDDDITPAKPTRRKKSKAEQSADNSLLEEGDGPKAAKVAANGGAKQPAKRQRGRENLSEEQKRENHIKSEQKRRTLIKEGFEDLGKIIPVLNTGGFSKAHVLSVSAEWLEEMLKGNEVLREKCAAKGL